MFCNLNNSAFGMKYKIVLLVWATFLFIIKGEIIEKNASTISIQESNIEVSGPLANEIIKVNQTVNDDQQEKLTNSQDTQSQHKVSNSPVSLFTSKRRLKSSSKLVSRE